MNVNFFSDLKFEYYREYCPEILLQERLNEETKIDGWIMKYFPKKLLCHEVFRSMVSWAAKLFLKDL